MNLNKRYDELRNKIVKLQRVGAPFDLNDSKNIAIKEASLRAISDKNFKQYTDIVKKHEPLLDAYHAQETINWYENTLSNIEHIHHVPTKYLVTETKANVISPSGFQVEDRVFMVLDSNVILCLDDLNNVPHSNMNLCSRDIDKLTQPTS